MIVASYCGPTCGTQFFVHVVGAIVLFGSVLAVTILAYAALRLAPELAQVTRRVGFWTTLGLMVPAWIAMYAGGYWVLGHEGLDKDDAGLGHRGGEDRRCRGSARPPPAGRRVALDQETQARPLGRRDRHALPRRARGRLVLHVGQA